MDHLTPNERSQLMSRIRAGDTKPEFIVRRLVHALGYRYRLHVRTLPGCPDLVFASRRKIIFIHGCFWHQHSCKRGTRPSSNQKFWLKKLSRNQLRDAAVVEALEAQDWNVMVVWECQLRNEARLTQSIIDFLGSAAVSSSPRSVRT